MRSKKEKVPEIKVPPGLRKHIEEAARVYNDARIEGSKTTALESELRQVKQNYKNLRKSYEECALYADFVNEFKDEQDRFIENLELVVKDFKTIRLSYEKLFLKVQRKKEKKDPYP